jgi:hypothetical protein
VQFHAEWGDCTGGALTSTASSGRGDDFIGLDLRCPCIEGLEGSVCTLPPPFPPSPPSPGVCCGDLCTPPSQACFCDCATSIECPDDEEVECGESTGPSATGIATVTKTGLSCGGIDDQDVVTYSDSPSGACPQTIVRTWTANLRCTAGGPVGRTHTCAQTINVQDTLAPVLENLPSNETRECTEPPAVTVTASDKCHRPITPLLATTTSPGCGTTKNITRTWTAIDSCGNAATATVLTRIVDTNPPGLTGVPGSTSAKCNAIPEPPTVAATDTCDASVVPVFSESNNTVAGQCQTGTAITRTWNATDDCGNSVSASQTITLLDDLAPVFPSPPANTEVSCDSTLPVLVDLDVTDTCGSARIVTKTEENSTGSCVQAPIVNRTWTAIDLCGNTKSVSQIIPVYDRRPPILVGVPVNMDAECDSVPEPPTTVTATDACDPAVAVQFEETNNTDPGECQDGKKIFRTWKASDNCTNSVTATQTISLKDTKAPTITCPANQTVACDACKDGSCLVAPTVSDNCGPVPTVKHVDASSPATIPANSTTTVNQTLAREYTATDTCGNSATCVQTISRTNVLAEVTVKRTANGAVDPTATYTFELYQGPPNGGYSGTLLASASTFGASDGVILDVFLNPALTYTLCERDVPAAWTNTFTVNGTAVLPYNPDRDNLPPESLGSYCYDFQPSSCSGLYNFVVDNSFGGGCPRTPGYWKVSRDGPFQVISFQAGLDSGAQRLTNCSTVLSSLVTPSRRTGTTVPKGARPSRPPRTEAAPKGTL